LPDAVGDALGKPVPELPSNHAELSAVMTLVRGKVGQEVLQVSGKVLPGRSGDPAIIGGAKVDQSDHPLATSRQGPHELRLPNATQVDQPRDLDAVARAEAFDPPATAVVDVRGDHADR
jgi:hypothetical protein